MIKKIFLLFIILIFSHCGFTPVYNSNKIDYKINIIETAGDKAINKKIRTEIKRISNSSSSKTYNIKIDTKYSKKIISKDLKGSPTDYQYTASVNFEINDNNNTEIVSYQEKQNIKKNSNLFEQRNYENTIKNDFAISLVRKLNLELSSK
ncbi:hypothetical protein OAP78_05840 [Candidatus Pelagibacter sp.]|nr:hypothetical protein [Candidatus Pelagibacter sp.]